MIPPPAGIDAEHDAFAPGLLPMLIDGLRAVGWWGSSHAGGRKHLLPLSMRSNALSSMRAATIVHAAHMCKGESVSIEMALPLLDAFLLQIVTIYEVLATPSASADADLLALAAMGQAAVVIDALRADQTQALGAALMRLAEGEYKRKPLEMVHALGEPLMAAFLPSQSMAVAAKLHTLLVRGPVSFCAPVNLLATVALSHSSAPQVHSDFHSIVELAVEGTSDEEAGLLFATMSAARVVEPINPAHFADGAPFAAGNKLVAENKTSDGGVVVTLHQVLVNWSSQGA